MSGPGPFLIDNLSVLAENVVTIDGLVGDGVADVGPTIQAKLDAGTSHLHFQPGTYRIATLISHTGTNDLKITADKGAKFYVESGGITIKSTLTGTLTLTANVAWQARQVTVADAAGVEIGDLLYFVTTVTAHATRPTYYKRHVTTVEGVSGTAITLRDPVNFEFNTGDAGLALNWYHRPRRVVIEDLHFETAEETPPSHCLALTNVVHSLVRNVSYRNTGTPFTGTGDGLQVNFSVDVVIEHTVWRGLRYAILPTTSRNVHIRDMRCDDSRHGPTPSMFCDGVYVDGLYGENNVGIMDAHDSFDVHYRHVRTSTDKEYSNIRAIGGSLRDSYFKSTNTNPAISALFFQVPFTTEGGEAYQHVRDAVIENVEWLVDAGITGTTGNIGIDKARYATVNNLRTNRGLGLSKGVANKITNAFVGNSVFDFSLSRFRCPVNLIEDSAMSWRGNNVNAVEESANVFTIRPYGRGIISQRKQRVQGVIVEDRQADGAELTGKIVIHTIHPTGPLNESTTAGYRFGVLRLLAVGGRDLNAMREEVFHFRQKLVTTSSGSFYTTPARTEKVSTRDMTITLSNPAFFGATETANGLEYRVEVDFTLSSEAISSLRYSLSYELELVGADNTAASTEV